MRKIFTIITLLLVVNVQVFAVTANPNPITFKQPNGDEVTIKIKGDERLHWSESMDGYTLLYNQAGYLTYAVLDEDGNLQPSDFIVTDIEKRDPTVHSFLNSIDKKLFYSDVQKQVMLKVWKIEDEYKTREPVDLEGQFKTICAFVQFPEKAMIKTINQFEGLMNQLGYTGNGTGSVRDFFKESSYNKFDLIITLCGIYTAPQSEAYYAGPPGDGTLNCRELARWIAQQVAAEPSINFADYDSNSDGKVDGFHFIFAGEGQEGGGGPTTIWSHQWDFSPPVTKNGKSISSYSCSPELASGTSITTVGVICHEMSHAFGAPDFYDTDYEINGQFDGTGKWDLMADGSWNGFPSGNRPAHHNMYTKIQFGWVVPTVLNSALTISSMPNSAENPVAYRINTTTNNEYFLLENRQKVKFDSDVPGNGLIIYHVHSNVGTSGINDTHPQRMYPVCASSTVQVPNSTPSSYGTINSAGCPFPGSSNKTSFTDTSTPYMKSWAGANTAKPLTDITVNTTTKTVSFKVMGGSVGGSNNANLRDITVSAGTLTPAFNKDILNYTVNVANTVTTITITGTPDDPNATVSGNVVNAPLIVGSNNFALRVTAEDGVTQKIYTVNVIRASGGGGNNNANLKSLTVSAGTLTPAFNPNTTSYTVNVVNTVTTITITGTPDDPNATVTGNVVNAPLNVGNNNFQIKVTATDGITTKTYTVNVIRASGGGGGTNANLKSLTVSAGTLTPSFNPNTTSYTVNVGGAVSTITITGVAADPNATVSGNVVNAPINPGNNNFSIVVTAADGTTTKTYTVNVIRSSGTGSNADLANLIVSAGTLVPVFDPAVTSYTVNVTNLVVMISIIGIPADPNAIVANVNNAPLSVGNNAFTVTVTADNGVNTKDYNVTVVRAPSSNSYLKSLTVSAGTLSPAFSPTTTNYTVKVNYTVATISITGVAADANATVTGNVTDAPINIGSNIFTLTVTASDNSTRNYTVTVIREGGPTDADLLSLTVNPGTLTPEFNPAVTSYNVQLDYTVAAITITGVASDPEATVTGNVTNAPLAFGTNNFMITVTTKNNISKNYHVKVVRGTLAQYTITSSVVNNVGGTISPAGAIKVDEGGSITFEMFPKDEHYIIEYVLVDDENIGTPNPYTFKNVTKDHTITVKFKWVYAAIEETEKQQITVYPNPTTGEIRFEISDMGYEILEIAIFDVFGKKLVSNLTSQILHQGIDISHLPTGIYFVKITTENGIVTKKIVKQ